MTRLALLAIAALPLAACATPQQQRGYDDYNRYEGPIQAGPQTDFRYSATGINWTMTIDNQQMQLRTDEGFAATNRLLDFTPNRQSGDVYRGEDMLVTIVQSPCTIGDGGQSYPHQVQVQLGGQSFRGCGQPSLVPPTRSRY